MNERGSSHGLRMLMRGLAVGAVAMYLLDPDKGRRRRAIARDKLRRFGNDAARLTQQATRDAGNRLHGVNAGLQQRRMARGDADELKVIERVRSALGRCVTHPHAVQVGARGGTVVLSGPILATEVPPLLAAVHLVPGVAAVENHLDVHTSEDGVPSLQGQRRRGQRGGTINTPAVRFAMLVGGGMVAIHGLAKRGFGGLALMSAGLGMAMRAVDQETASAVAAAARSAMSGAGGREGSVERGAWDETRTHSTSALGADGTPAGRVGEGERTPASDLAQGAKETPRIGNDGTGSAMADQRTSAARAGDGNLSLPETGTPPNTTNRPPL